MTDLKIWLNDHGMAVTELAQELNVPVNMARDWVYRGVAPSEENQAPLTDFMFSNCAHHWVIEPSNGPLSGGVCRRCGQSREFQNSVDTPPWPIAQRKKGGVVHH